MNVGKKVRLQLYKPGSYNRKSLQKSDVFTWWCKRKWVKYPASLHVTVKSIPVPQDVEETFRSKIPVVGERGSEGLSQGNNKSDADKENVEDKKLKIKWKKTEHQTSKLPNKCLTELDACNEGAFVIKFSNKGEFLAVAVALEEVYTIKVYVVREYISLCSLKQCNCTCCPKFTRSARIII